MILTWETEFDDAPYGLFDTSRAPDALSLRVSAPGKSVAVCSRQGPDKKAATDTSRGFSRLTRRRGSHLLGDINDLELSKLLETFFTKLCPDTGLLGTAERNARIQRSMLINRNGACIHLVSQRVGSIDIR